MSLRSVTTSSARTELPPRFVDRTVPDLLAACVAEVPDAPAVIAHTAAGGESQLTFRELEQAAARAAGGLSALGVGRGDRVGLLLSNECALETNVLMHAAHRVGAVAAPISTRFVAGELEWCLGAADCGVVFYEQQQAEKVAQVRAGAGGATAFVGLGGRMRGDDPAWEEVRDEAATERVALSEGEQANWMFTSGTTGRPKIVAHTHVTTVACGIQTAEAWDLHAGDVYLDSFPTYAGAGFNTAAMGALWGRATHVIEPRFDPATSVANAQRVGATAVYWLTPMLILVLESGALEGADLSSVRRILYGGQAMDREFHLRLDELFSVGMGIELVHMIGLSEAGPSGLMLDPELHAAKPGAIGNRGFSRELTEFALLDVETGAAAGPGGSGELCYRTPSVMDGYVGAPEETAEAMRGGWLHSGDVCRFDDEGVVYFVDRIKDVIRRGGMNIASAEVERELVQCPGVAEVAAVPHPHPVLGEVVKVVVVRRSGAEIDERSVIAFAAGRLAEYKVPRVVAFVDELPRNAMGKVMKAELR